MSRAVVIQVPGNLSTEGLEIAVHEVEDTVQVDVRPANSWQAWQPLEHVGGSVRVRVTS